MWAIIPMCAREKQHERFCKMHKFFKKKRALPNNWKNLSQEQALEIIQYLLSNYRKHKISFDENGEIKIDNISIHQQEVQILGYTYNVYVINKRMFTVDGEVGHYISRLIDCCKHAKDKQRLPEKLKNFGKIINEKKQSIKANTSDTVDMLNQRVRGF